MKRRGSQKEGKGIMLMFSFFPFSLFPFFSFLFCLFLVFNSLPWTTTVVVAAPDVVDVVVVVSWTIRSSWSVRLEPWELPRRIHRVSLIWPKVCFFFFVSFVFCVINMLFVSFSLCVSCFSWTSLILLLLHLFNDLLSPCLSYSSSFLSGVTIPPPIVLLTPHGLSFSSQSLHVTSTTARVMLAWWINNHGRFRIGDGSIYHRKTDVAHLKGRQ